ncbi:DEKNAAC104694 [Brettanomyces naardenensis]|uniref:Succinate dehydrogenase assembly factor 3 n=1 Tax=Brettanomyces naardenensis TaxID=13370 RepID=A0A448YR07_BRENA|nr:DEKNAAC104694 [Brettanomyces naardenensis]
MWGEGAIYLQLLLKLYKVGTHRMRATLILRRARTPKPWRNGPPLLQPLQLYREILRAHRKLPKTQRDLGDPYVKAEFRAHKDIDNPLQIIGFLTSWQEYLTMVKKNTDEDWKRYQISKEAIDKMSDDQIIQFYELMKETKNIYNDSNDAPSESEEDNKS